MNILTAINENWVLPARALIASIKDSNRKTHINIYIMFSELSSSSINQILSDETQWCKIIPVKVDDSDILHIDSTTKEAYLRLFASVVLPHDIDRIMWIDADIVVTKPLQEFYDQPIDDYYYIACSEVGNLKGKRKARLENLHLPEDFPYINSGVLMINLQEIRKVETWVDDIDLYIKTTDSDLLYADQDIINVLFNANGKVKVLKPPCFYNQRASKEYYRKPYAVLHYAGKNKPWIMTGQRGFFVWYKYAFKIKGLRMHILKLMLFAVVRGVFAKLKRKVLTKKK